MKAGDRVVMTKNTSPKSNFRTGVVLEAGCYGMIRVKRDYYRGHETTWWNKSDWKVVKVIPAN